MICCFSDSDGIRYNFEILGFFGTTDPLNLEKYGSLRAADAYNFELYGNLGCIHFFKYTVR